MNHQDILTSVQDIIRDIMDDNTLIITGETQANDVENWDSLAHISIVTSIEKHFKIRFSISEIDSFHNVGVIISTLEKKLQ